MHIPPTDQTSARRLSGYGLSNEDLIVSDEDTLSVDYDPASAEYCGSPDAYSENYEEEEEDDLGDLDVEDLEEDEDENEFIPDDETDDEDLLRDSPMSSPQPEDNIPEENDNQEDHDMDKESLPVPHDEKEKEVAVVSPTDTGARTKFSIGSLMNDTKEPTGGNIQEVGGKDANDGVDNTSGGIIDNCDDLICDIKSELKTIFASPNSQYTFGKECSSDEDEAPEELDSRGHALGLPPKPATRERYKLASHGLPDRALERYLLQSPEKFSSLLKAAKLAGAEYETTFQPGRTTLTDVYRHTPQSNTPSPPANDLKFTSRPTLLGEALPRTGRTMFGGPQIQPPTHRGARLPPTLPWVRDPYAVACTVFDSPSLVRTAPATQPPTQVEASKVDCANLQKDRPMQHLFEQILNSDESKARKAQLETLKAAVNNANRPFNVISWGGYDCLIGNGGDDDVEMGSSNKYYSFGSNPGGNVNVCSNPIGDVDYCRTFLSQPKSVRGSEKPSSKDDNRSFSISNLVHEDVHTSPIAEGLEKWVAEKAPKDVRVREAPQDVKNPHESAPTQVFELEVASELDAAASRGNKRKYEEISKDNSVEEKVQPLDAPYVTLPTAEELRIVSEEKEICEQKPDEPMTAEKEGVLESIQEDTAPDMMQIDTVVTSTAEMHIDAAVTNTAEVRGGDGEPVPKRVCRWPGITAGFAAGAVAGAVGMFAALVNTA